MVEAIDLLVIREDNDMDKAENQMKLQEMLSAARGALDEALSFAKQHDLCFDFSGVRRGPEYEASDGSSLTNRWIDANDPKCREDEEYSQLDVVVSDLDISYEWVGSHC